MAKTTEVKVRITGDSKSVEKAAKRTTRAFTKLTGFLKGSFVPLIAGGLGLRALVNAFRSVTKAAAEQEDAIRSLDAALLPLGDAAADVSKRLQEQAAALQKVTTAGDETIIKGQALIASFTKDEEQIKKATAAALDLSAAVGVELNAAFLLMGKAAAGETTTLSRYGIILDEGIPKSEKFAAALTLVNEQFGGRAQEQAKTFSGAVGQIGNAFGDLKEKVGAALTENEKVVAQLQRLKEILEDEGTVDSVAALAENMVALAIAMGKAAAAAKTLITPLDNQVLALAEQTEAFKKSNTAINGWADTLKGKALRALNLWWNTIGESLGLLDKWEGGITRVRKATDALSWAQERENRILDELNKNKDKLLEASERLGIVLEKDVADKIRANNDLLELYESQLDSGVIKAEDFARAQIAIAAANQELRNSLLPATTEIVNLGSAYGAAVPLMDSATSATQRFAAATVAANTVVTELRGDFARQAAERRARLSGYDSDFAQIGGGTFTFQSPGVVQEPDGRLRAA